MSFGETVDPPREPTDGTVHLTGLLMTRVQKFSVHACLFDSDCREYGAPRWRLHVNTRWWGLGIALSPGCRFVEMAPPWKARWVAGERFDWTQVPMRNRWTSFRRWP